jgi:hypothetical protein
MTATEPSGQPVANQKVDVIPTASAERAPVRTAGTGSDQSRHAMFGLRQFLTPVEGSHALAKPGARKPEVALVRCAHQRRYDWSVSSEGFVGRGDPDARRCGFFWMRQRTGTMARRSLCRCAELHRGLGQPAQRLIENARLGALEISRLLHRLNVEIGLGELGPLGVEALAVGIGLKQDRREAVGAASQSAHKLDELWRELPHQDQATHKRRTDDPKRDLREPRQQQIIGSSRREGGRDADDGDRVACELETIRREIAYRTGREVAETDPYGYRGHEELAVLVETKYQRDCNKQPGDGAKHTIEALGEN